MFCPECGKQIEDYALFCPECGTKIEQQPQQPSANEAPTTGRKPAILSATQQAHSRA